MANTWKSGLLFTTLACVILHEGTCMSRRSLYDTKYIEGDCRSHMSVSLAASGSSSSKKINSRRETSLPHIFREEARNCTVTIKAPKGYGIILSVISVEYGIQLPSFLEKKCFEYFQVSGSEGRSPKVCGSTDKESQGPFFSDGDLKMQYTVRNGSFGYKMITISTVVTAFTSTNRARNHFRCRNGRFIWDGLTCDQVNNCGDNSDEEEFGGSNCRRPRPTFQPPDVWTYGNRYTISIGKNRNRGKMDSAMIAGVVTAVIVAVACVVAAVGRWAKKEAASANAEAGGGNRPHRVVARGRVLRADGRLGRPSEEVPDFRSQQNPGFFPPLPMPRDGAPLGETMPEYDKPPSYLEAISMGQRTVVSPTAPPPDVSSFARTEEMPTTKQ